MADTIPAAADAAAALPPSLPAADAAGSAPAASPAAAVAAVGASILAEAPEVSPEFVAKKRAEFGMVAADPETQGEPLKDRRGYIFDPKYCRIDKATGAPVFSAGGSFEMKTAKDGKRYKRDEVLRRRVYKKRAPQAEPLELPPELQDTAPAAAGEPAAPAADAAGIAGAAALVDDRQRRAEELAFVCDEMFWSLSGIVAPGDVVAAYKAQLSTPGKTALSTGFQTLDEVPAPPWWLMASMIYAPALGGMMMHEKSKPKRQWLKDKLAMFWLKLRGRRAPVDTYQEQPRRHAPPAPEPAPEQVY